MHKEKNSDEEYEASIEASGFFTFCCLSLYLMDCPNLHDADLLSNVEIQSFVAGSQHLESSSSSIGGVHKSSVFRGCAVGANKNNIPTAPYRTKLLPECTACRAMLFGRENTVSDDDNPQTVSDDWKLVIWKIKLQKLMASLHSSIVELRVISISLLKLTNEK